MRTDSRDEIPESGNLAYIGRLRPFLSLDDLEFNCVAFLQAFITVTGDGAVVDENVRPTVASQKAVPFRVIEPLHRAFDSFHLCSLSLDSPKRHYTGGSFKRGDILSLAGVTVKCVYHKDSVCGSGPKRAKRFVGEELSIRKSQYLGCEIEIQDVINGVASRRP